MTPKLHQTPKMYGVQAPARYAAPNMWGGESDTATHTRGAAPLIRPSTTAPHTMGLVSKGATCDINGCDAKGARSINALKVRNAGLKADTGSKKAILCRDHYKEYKKESKSDRDLERARWS